MAILSENGFNIGQDASVTLMYLGNGSSAPIPLPASALGILMSISADQKTGPIEVVPISNGGLPLLENTYRGWTGTLVFTRTNGALDGILSALEQNFFNGLRAQFNIAVTVTNLDGTIDQYMYQSVILTSPHSGEYRADKEVEQRIGFEAAQRVITSGIGTLIPLLS